MYSPVEDLRYAARILRKTPLWTASAIGALAIGIALNTTMFSSADVLMLRPLLVPEADRVVAVNGRERDRPSTVRHLSPIDFLTVRNESQTLESVAATRAWNVSMTGAGYPERLSAFRVSAAFFEVIRQQPAAGRFFTELEEQDGRHRVAVISYAVWERRFGRDTSAIGKTVRLNDEPYVIVGVMPESFRYPLTAELWAPLVLAPAERREEGSFSLDVLARLHGSADLAKARAEIDSLADRIRREHPQTHSRLRFRIDTLNERVSGNLTREYTWMMLGASLFVLLICCANVANLQLARILSRTREMAVRSALGAGTFRLLGQLLTEHLLLAALAMLAAVTLAHWGVDFIRGSMPAEVEQFLPGWRRMAVDGRALVYTTAISLFAALAAGLLPAWLLSRTNANNQLRDGSRTSTGGKGRQILRGSLVVSQMVLALVLLAGATLMIKGFGAILRLWPNVEARQVLTFRVTLPQGRYTSDKSLVQFHQKALDGIRNLTGVEQASFAAYLPQSQRDMSTPVEVENRPVDPKAPPKIVDYQVADREFLEALRIPIQAGRGLTSQDREGSIPVAVITEAMAREVFPGENPLGRRVAHGPPSSAPTWITIVGIASDVTYDYTNRRPFPMMYVAAPQFPERSVDYVIRTSGKPSDLVPAVRSVIESIDPIQPIYEVRTLQALAEHGLSGIAYVAGFLGFMGAVALFLSVLGIYSVVAYVVAERTREIGVRMALGASQRDILWMVLQQGLALAGFGLGLGVPLAFFVVRMLSGLVFGVSPQDWVAFGVVPLVLGLAALTATLLPARRATATEPTVALHHE